MGIADEVAKKFPLKAVPCGCRRTSGNGEPMMGVLRQAEGIIHPCSWCIEECAEAFWLYRAGKITPAGYYRRLRKAGKPR